MIIIINNNNTNKQATNKGENIYSIY